MSGRKVIILQHGGGELTNQLWNFASVYAYALHSGRECRNYSFFEYGNFFNMPVGNALIRFLFFAPMLGFRGRRSAWRARTLRFMYKLFYAKPIGLILGRNLISSQNIRREAYYLPPTKQTPELSAKENLKTLYLTGWLFRNPEGLKKYRREILDYFRPTREISDWNEKLLCPLRQRYDRLVGVHIRQSDYAEYKSGEFLISPKRAREIMDEYLEHFGQDRKRTYFLLASDGPIDRGIFSGLEFGLSGGNAVEDLFALSGCDVILGSDSSFGGFAAYYGDIPHIVFKKEKMDWPYYEDKKGYFENKYCALVHY